MDQIDLHSCIYLKEERADEAETTNELKEEDEMLVQDEDGLIHTKEEDEMLVPDEDGLIHVKQEEVMLVSDEDGLNYADEEDEILVVDGGLPEVNRWTNCRDNFRIHLQKHKTKTGPASKNRKKYKCKDRLPHSNDRGLLSSCKIKGASNTCRSKNIQIDIDAIEEARQDGPTNTKVYKPHISSTGRVRVFGGRRKLEHILVKNKHIKVTKVPSNDIDTFLAGIASTMKRLNPYNQHIAKGRIFNVVHQLESQELFSNG